MTPVLGKSCPIKLSAQIENPLALFVVVFGFQIRRNFDGMYLFSLRFTHHDLLVRKIALNVKLALEVTETVAE